MSYAPLNDLDAAFDDDDDAPSLPHPPTIPGAYDFEREYDFPPPGSPPAPSAHALPNDYGNSNGLLPTQPPQRPSTSIFRRAVGALLPSHYIRVPTSNDGVFANVVAKPQRPHAPDGNVYIVPEETSQKDIPPSYADAQADAVPPYWETTVHAPSTDGPLIIDDIPTGSPWIFLINLFLSYFFQFIGFLFTYLLHTSHAAKYGSRAGLGLTLIQFGFYSRTMGRAEGGDTPPPPPPRAPADDSDTIPGLSISSRDWLAFLFMTLGWFVFLTSLIGYIRIKRWERSVRSPPPPVPVPAPSPEAVERDREIRRNLASVFGMPFEEERHQHMTRDQLEAQDARLARDLRAAGLL